MSQHVVNTYCGGQNYCTYAFTSVGEIHWDPLQRNCMRTLGFDVWSMHSVCQDSRVHFFIVIGSKTILDYVMSNLHSVPVSPS